MIKFYITIGRETFQKVESILIDGAERYNLSVEFTPSGDKILDLEVKLQGDLSSAAEYVKWMVEIINLYRNGGSK